MKSKEGLKTKWLEFEEYYDEFVKEIKDSKLITRENCPICQARHETNMTAPEEQNAYGRTCPVCQRSSVWA